MMSPDLKVYWRIYDETVSNEDLISVVGPLKDYEDDFIPGPILDIGAGISPVLLEYSKTDRELFAIDSEKFQLDNLKKRMIRLNGKANDQWHFLELNYPAQALPNTTFAVVVLSHFLHFFTLNQAAEIIKRLKDQTEVGSIIYLVVHSTKCIYNQPQDPDNNDYFKHFFSVNDLDALFPINEFVPVYIKDIERAYYDVDRRVYVKWIESLLS